MRRPPSTCCARRAESAGIFVLLKGDLGNYLTALDTGVFRGFSIADQVAPFIVINDQDARPAWSFTLLHEAMHLLLGHTGVGNAQTDNGIERFCDDVAGAFLLPAGELDALALDSDNLNELSERISRFAAETKVSRTMVAYRAEREGPHQPGNFRQSAGRLPPAMAAGAGTEARPGPGAGAGGRAELLPGTPPPPGEPPHHAGAANDGGGCAFHRKSGPDTRR